MNISAAIWASSKPLNATRRQAASNSELRLSACARGDHRRHSRQFAYIDTGLPVDKRPAVQLLREAETAESAGKSSGGDPAERLAKVLDFAGKAALMHRLSLHDSLKEVQGVADAGPAPDTLLERKEERQALRQAIAGLSEREQLIVRRYYFEGKTLEEIAKECGGASKSWICRLHARAVEKMRQAYFGESCPNAYALPY